MDANEYFVAHLWAWLQLGVVIARTYVFLMYRTILTKKGQMELSLTSLIVDVFKRNFVEYT